MNTRRITITATFILAATPFLAVWTLLARQNTPPAEDPKQQTNYYGSSGGNAKDSISGKCCSGTLGALVFAGSRKYILSANHVIGMMGNASPGDPISQPGLTDTRCDVPRTVGHFTVASPLSDGVDAAIAELADGTMDASGTILGIGAPSPQIVEPQRDLRVVKSGRTTGVTHGVIQSYSTRLKVDYSGGCRSVTPPLVRFNNLMVIQGQTSAFAEAADSGSLVLTEDKHPVGLVIGGNETLTLANPISAVLGSLSKRLGATLGFGRSPGLENYTAELQLPDRVRQALAAKQTLFASFADEPSVLGVGVTGETGEGRPMLIVYVHGEIPSARMDTAGVNVDAAGETHYRGTQVKIVNTSQFRAFSGNQERSDTNQCAY
jgi:hypothetical protein